MHAPKLRYSRELKEVVELRDVMTADEALHLLVDELLGPHYCIVDPVSGKQTNAIIVNDILREYAPRKRLK